MLKLPAEVRVYISLEPCDMRRQLDGLAALVRSGMERDPENGDLYIFCNRRSDMLKALFADLASSWTPGSPACGQQDRHHADTEIAVEDSGIGAMRTAISPQCGHRDRSCGQPDRRHVDTDIGCEDSQIAA